MIFVSGGAQAAVDPVGSAVRELVGLNLAAEELDPAVCQAIGVFAALGLAELLRDPSRARDECRNMSVTFESVCLHRGIPAGVVSGAFSCEVAEFPGREVVLAVHAAVRLPSRRNAAGAWEREVVVDWTGRQFDGSVPVPLIVPMPAWRRVWRELAENNHRDHAASAPGS
jgi:hypothetical protein